jgi:hypothetical protein
MTREEAIDYLKRSLAIECEDDDIRYHNEILEFTIKALEQEPCEDAISRTQALSDYADWYGYGYRDNAFYKLLKDMPPVTPKTETAHWIKVPDEKTFFCSKCNCRLDGLDDEQTYLLLNFCPNCGCKMVKSQESEDKE